MALKRTQRDWTEIAIKVLEERAQEAGLLGADERLVFEPGSSVNGVSPTIIAYNETGRVRTQPHWVPTFVPKDTARTVERCVDAAANVLYYVNLQRGFIKAIDKQD